MQTVTKLEKKAADWYKGAPHLPLNGRKWLTANIWWITLIGAIVGALSIITVISGTFLVGFLATVYGGPVGAAVAGFGAIVILLALLFSIASTAVTAMAISPLKAKQKRGWTLLFISVLIQVAAAAVHLVFTFNIFDLIWSLLFAALGAYFLFEIRDDFSGVKAAKTVTAKK